MSSKTRPEEPAHGSSDLDQQPYVEQEEPLAGQIPAPDTSQLSSFQRLIAAAVNAGLSVTEDIAPHIKRRPSTIYRAIAQLAASGVIDDPRHHAPARDAGVKQQRPHREPSKRADRGRRLPTLDELLARSGTKVETADFVQTLQEQLQAHPNRPVSFMDLANEFGITLAGTRSRYDSLAPHLERLGAKFPLRASDSRWQAMIDELVLHQHQVGKTIEQIAQALDIRIALVDASRRRLKAAGRITEETHDDIRARVQLLRIAYKLEMKLLKTC